MKAYVVFLVIVISIFFSCKKEDSSQNKGEAKWIKVISDLPVYNTGKIRADAQNNLYCSYNYKSYKIDTNSGIIKLDSEGNILWQRNFTSLAIYDFVINSQNNLVLVSYSSGTITLTNLSPDNTISTIGSYDLPLTAQKIISMITLKIFCTSTNNYNIYGSVTYKQSSTTSRQGIGFIIQADTGGNLLWLKKYSFEPGVATTITGCVEISDGYLMLGNIQHTDFPIISSLFILKSNIQGDSSWIKIYPTSSYIDSAYHGYYCSTTDFISSGDGNFFGAGFNFRYNIPTVVTPPIYSDDDNSARLLKFNEEGDIISTTKLKYDLQNQVADLILTRGNGLMIGFNPIKLYGTFYIGNRSSFVIRLGSDLTLQSEKNIQSHYIDVFGSLCLMHDGHYAIETMIQSFGKDYYQLEIIKTDESGNF